MMRPPKDRHAGSEPGPLYRVVRDHVESQIVAGTLKPQDRVPSENDLVRTLGVSRMTVNRALRELAAEGLIRRVQGVGSFVAAPKPQSALLEIRSIADEIVEHGGTYGCTIVKLAEELTDREAATAMDMPVGARIFHSVIVHYENGAPVQVEDRLVNPAVAPDYLEQDFTRITPNRYLVEVTPISEAEHIIEATLPDRTTQELLDVGRHEPCLVLFRRTWSRGRIVTRARLIHPGTRYRLGSRFQPRR